MLKPQLELMKTPFRILDLCTGTGCIGLALAAHLPRNRVEITGVDISADAIKLAQENLLLHKEKMNNPVELIQQDLFEYECDNRFNLIVSNPPYISHDEYNHIDPGVKDWEDPRALVTGEDGRLIHNKIIELAKHCQPILHGAVPRLIMEIGGSHQVVRLKQTLQINDFQQVEVWKDLAEKDRVIAAK